ncbi:MAG: DnaK suppressor protein [Verrucomicrobiales bacterium]
MLELRDHLVDAMGSVAQDNLRSNSEGADSSAFGMHQADAGSDAYDRDFALNLLSQEQDALYEIDGALERVDRGVYGICEVSGEKIPEARLEAIPFARLTVHCQEKLEQKLGPGNRGGYGRPARSLVGLMDNAGESVDSD